MAAFFCTVCWASGSVAETAEDTPSLPRWVAFSAVDIGRDGGSFHSGVRRAFRGAIDRSGFLAAIETGVSLYRYEPGSRLPGSVIGLGEWRTAMLGYQHFQPGFGITALAGIDYQRHRLMPFDNGNPVRGRRYGTTARLEAWAKPRPGVLLSASASGSTVFRSYHVQTAMAFGLYRGLALGPEVSVCGNSESLRGRLGLKLDGIRLYTLSISVAGGVYSGHDDFADALSGRDGKTGLYGTLAVRRKY
ncbi:MAG: cellulose biosynthesis protein BcsS [Hyphomicrobiales bacterium]|nr:cellulose biosynthesis protein BcsS [Hyphomicrobiales bacterium]